MDTVTFKRSLDLVTFGFCTTAIATVPIASTLVVAVVALAVSLPGEYLCKANEDRYTVPG